MYIRVRVTPGSKREEIIQKNIDSFDVFVKEAAKNNAANTKVKMLLAKHFQVSVKAVRLLSGHRSPQKIFSIRKECDTL